MDRLDVLDGKVASGSRMNLARVVGEPDSQSVLQRWQGGGGDFTMTEDWNSKQPGSIRISSTRVVSDTVFSTETYVPVFEDTDGDGMPDEWKKRWGGLYARGIHGTGDRTGMA